MTALELAGHVPFVAEEDVRVHEPPRSERRPIGPVLGLLDVLAEEPDGSITHEDVHASLMGAGQSPFRIRVRVWHGRITAQAIARQCHGMIERTVPEAP